MSVAAPFILFVQTAAARLCCKLFQTGSKWSKVFQRPLYCSRLRRPSFRQFPDHTWRHIHNIIISTLSIDSTRLNCLPLSAIVIEWPKNISRRCFSFLIQYQQWTCSSTNASIFTMYINFQSFSTFHALISKRVAHHSSDICGESKTHIGRQHPPKRPAVQQQNVLCNVFPLYTHQASRQSVFRHLWGIYINLGRPLWSAAANKTTGECANTSHLTPMQMRRRSSKWTAEKTIENYRWRGELSFAFDWNLLILRWVAAG